MPYEKVTTATGSSNKHRVEVLTGALEDIIDRSYNGDLGTSKVIDMRKIAEAALNRIDRMA